MTSETGTLVEEIQYERFVREIATPEERYMYKGKQRDETGLYYYGAHHYHSETGRFVSEDFWHDSMISPLFNGSSHPVHKTASYRIGLSRE